MRRAARRSGPQRRFETWQIIYMDLMTNVMIFFLVLWAINERQTKGISHTVGDETVKMMNLPGDVVFEPSKATFTSEGTKIFSRLFHDPTGQVLNFDVGGLSKRMLVIHGHTDSDGDKEENLELGYARARAAYSEIRKYSEEIVDHVVLCTHADNTPAQEVPSLTGTLSRTERNAVRAAKARNRRITIEDKLVNRLTEDTP